MSNRLKMKFTASIRKILFLGSSLLSYQAANWKWQSTVQVKAKQGLLCHPGNRVHQTINYCRDVFSNSPLNSYVNSKASSRIEISLLNLFLLNLWMAIRGGKDKVLISCCKTPTERVAVEDVVAWEQQELDLGIILRKASPSVWEDSEKCGCYPFFLSMIRILDENISNSAYRKLLCTE